LQSPFCSWRKNDKMVTQAEEFRSTLAAPGAWLGIENDRRKLQAPIWHKTTGKERTTQKNTIEICII
jgi:hypothetical protein